VTFSSASDLEADIKFVPEKKSYFHYALYYPDAKGYVSEKRIELKPKACRGHTHRFTQEGWGLIFLQLKFMNDQCAECRVAVNSNTRANNWRDTYPLLKSPDLWDWKVVNQHAGRIVRLVRKLGKKAEQKNGGTA
jgi:hypothetical protein